MLISDWPKSFFELFGQILWKNPINFLINPILKKTSISVLGFIIPISLTRPRGLWPGLQLQQHSLCSLPGFLFPNCLFPFCGQSNLLFLFLCCCYSSFKKCSSRDSMYNWQLLILNSAAQIPLLQRLLPLWFSTLLYHSKNFLDITYAINYHCIYLLFMYLKFYFASIM